MEFLSVKKLVFNSSEKFEELPEYRRVKEAFSDNFLRVTFQKVKKELILIFCWKSIIMLIELIFLCGFDVWKFEKHHSFIWNFTVKKIKKKTGFSEYLWNRSKLRWYRIDPPSIKKTMGADLT